MEEYDENSGIGENYTKPMGHTKGGWLPSDDEIKNNNGSTFVLCLPSVLPLDKIACANARRICQCVNSHDDLLAACEYALQELESSRKKNKMGCSFPYITTEAICSKLEAAIKKTKE